MKTTRALRLGLAALAIASPWACSRGARAVRLPALQGDEEIYRITCDEDIQPCREKALELCGGVYQVLETAGAPVAPRRITTAPGPASTGPRYQRLKWVGQMVIACGDAPPPVEAARSMSELPVEEPLPRPALSPGQVCVPGATQECLGPGACRGAQACLTDGRGYGSCDCGSGADPATPSRSPVDAGSPTPAVAP